MPEGSLSYIVYFAVHVHVYTCIYTCTLYMCICMGKCACGGVLDIGECVVNSCTLLCVTLHVWRCSVNICAFNFYI